MMDIYNSERTESLNLIAEQYESLLLRIARGDQAGLCEALVKVLPGWEQEIIGQWRGGLLPIYDMDDLHCDDAK